MLNKKEKENLQKICNYLQALINGSSVLPELPFTQVTQKENQPPVDTRFKGMKKNARAFYDALLKKYPAEKIVVIAGNEELRKIAFDCHVDNVAAQVRGFGKKGLAAFVTDEKQKRPVMKSFFISK